MFGKKPGKLSVNPNNSQSITGFNQTRKQFEKSLALKPSDIKQSEVLKVSENVGKIKGGNAVMKQLLDVKKEERKELLKSYDMLLNYTEEAAKDELQWQQITSDKTAKIAEMGLKIASEQSQQIGFSSYVPQAQQLIKY